MHWIREVVAPSIDRAMARASTVLAVPGTSSSRTCPSQRSAHATSSICPRLPTTTHSTLSRSAVERRCHAVPSTPPASASPTDGAGGPGSSCSGSSRTEGTPLAISRAVRLGDRHVHNLRWFRHPRKPSAPGRGCGAARRAIEVSQFPVQYSGERLDRACRVGSRQESDDEGLAEAQEDGQEAGAEDAEGAPGRETGGCEAELVRSTSEPGHGRTP